MNKCRHCNNNFNSSLELKRHYSFNPVHKGLEEDEFECYVCLEMLDSRGELIEHLKDDHDVHPKEEDNDDEEEEERRRKQREEDEEDRLRREREDDDDNNNNPFGGGFGGFGGGKSSGGGASSGW